MSSEPTRLPDFVTWDTFPFRGALEPKPLDPPAHTEPPREGDPGGGDCIPCSKPDERYLWVDEQWRLGSPGKPSGLPFVGILEPRPHLDLGDLDESLAGRMGVVLYRVERAVAALPGVQRVHLARYGDGRAHLHWLVLARPAGALQLRGNFTLLWDQVIPPLPETTWLANRAHVAETLARHGGRCMEVVG